MQSYEFSHTQPSNSDAHAKPDAYGDASDAYDKTGRVKAEAAGMTWLSDTLHARYVLFGDADRDGVVDRTEYEELMVAHSRSFHGEL